MESDTSHIYVKCTHCGATYVSSPTRTTRCCGPCRRTGHALAGRCKVCLGTKKASKDTLLENLMYLINIQNKLRGKDD